MQYQSKNVLCPFYISHDKNTIKCECLYQTMNVNSYIMQKFGSKDQSKWLLQYCCKNYKQCPIEKILEKKYLLR